MFTPASIPKGIYTRTTKSRSDWGKADTKSIDLIFSSYVLLYLIVNSHLYS